jgi:hypothetical protein
MIANGAVNMMARFDSAKEMTRSATVSLIIMFFASAALAQEPTVEDFLNACSTAPGAPTELCLSRIRHVIDSISTNKITRRTDCIPDYTKHVDIIVSAVNRYFTAMTKYRIDEKNSGYLIDTGIAMAAFTCNP